MVAVFTAQAFSLMTQPRRFKDTLKQSALLLAKKYRNATSFFLFPSEVLQHQCQDKWGKIQVIDHEGQRVLSFNSVYEQSRMDLYAPNELVHDYTRAMLLGIAFSQPAHITLLGLGGGCLLRAAHLIDARFQIQVVELRAAVVEIAHDYFGLPQASNIQITVEDGRHYMTQQADASTDLIVADMYHSLRADPYQMQKKFFQESHRVLSDNGWLVINCHEAPAVDSPFLRFMKSYFPDIRACYVPGGNVVFYAGKSGLQMPQERIPLEIELFEMKIRTKLSFLLANIQPITHAPVCEKVA